MSHIEAPETARSGSGCCWAPGTRKLAASLQSSLSAAARRIRTSLPVRTTASA